MKHPYEVTSREGLIQQLVIHLKNGYWFHVSGAIPDNKDPYEVDDKLMRKYDCLLSKYQKARRKAKGCYNTQYLRFKQNWVLLATLGVHPLDEKDKPFKEGLYVAERRNLKNAHCAPVKVEGYAVGYRRGGDGKYHVMVRIEKERYKELRDYLVGMATRRNLGWCINQIWNLPYEPYEPVRKQLKAIVRQMNAARKRAGYQQIPEKFIPWRRKIVKPFAAEAKLKGFARNDELCYNAR